MRSRSSGLRPGTENVAAIVGLGAAAVLTQQALPQLGADLRQQRDRLHERLAREIPGLLLNGHPEQRLPNTLHVSFPGVSGRALLEAAADVVAASVGSACHSEHDVVSGVLAAMGIDPARHGCCSTVGGPDDERGRHLPSGSWLGGRVAALGHTVTPEHYEGWYHTPRGAWIAEVEFRLPVAMLHPRPANPLDVGCGTGYFARRFAREAGLKGGVRLSQFRGQREGRLLAAQCHEL